LKSSIENDLDEVEVRIDFNKFLSSDPPVMTIFGPRARLTETSVFDGATSEALAASQMKW